MFCVLVGSSRLCLTRCDVWMLEVTTRIESRGIMSRLRMIRRALTRRRVDVEKTLSQGDDLGGSVSPSVYDTDAEESLAMALGKDTSGDVRGGVVFKKPLNL